jgi:hypothetical protein
MHNRRTNGQTDEEMDKSGQANADMSVTQTQLLSKKNYLVSNQLVHRQMSRQTDVQTLQG